TGGHVMRSLRNAVVLLAFLVLAVLPVAATAQPGYVALGDSVDFGIGSSTGAGWVVPFNGFLSSPSVFSSPVELVNLAVPGADPAPFGDATIEAPLSSAIKGGGLNCRLRAAAARQGAKVIELFLPFAFFGDLALGGDCIHPNDFGYSLIVLQAVTAFAAP